MIFNLKYIGKRLYNLGEINESHDSLGKKMIFFLMLIFFVILYIILFNVGFADSIDKDVIESITVINDTTAVTDVPENNKNAEQAIFTKERLLKLKEKLQFLAIFELESLHKWAKAEFEFRDTGDWSLLSSFLFLFKGIYFFGFLLK